MQGVLIFITQKDDGGNASTTRNKLQQTIGQTHQGDGKKKEAVVHQKITPLKALVDREGQKVPLLKGMYIVKLLALI